MNSDKEERLIGELMKRSARELPFADFEDKLMEQVYQKANLSRRVLKEVRLSWFFFIVGTLFGLFLNVVAAEFHKTIFGLSAQRVVFILQILFVIFLLFQFDKLVGLTKKSDWQGSDSSYPQ